MNMLAIDRKPSSDYRFMKKYSTPGKMLKSYHTNHFNHQIPDIQSKTVCPCDGGCPRCIGIIQPKLTVGQPNDIYEQEADRIAEQVMRMPEPEMKRPIEPEEEYEASLQAKPLTEQITPLVQKQVKPEEEDEDVVQTKPNAGRIAPLIQCEVRESEKGEEGLLQAKSCTKELPELGPEIEARIEALKGRGVPLPKAVSSYMEPRFVANFSNVKVHTDGDSVETARIIGARAFAIGGNIIFGDGQYAPESVSGRCLLAHELTHVIQQGNAKFIPEKIDLTYNMAKKSEILSYHKFSGKNAIQRQAALPAPVIITIQRDTETVNSTTGTLTVGPHNLYSLELPDRGNAATGNPATAGRIPAGIYNAHIRMNAGGANWRLELEGVPGPRVNIQIHTGNVPAETEGCILPGTSRGADVVNDSAAARNQIRQEVINAGAGAPIQVIIIDTPAAPVPAPIPAPAP